MREQSPQGRRRWEWRGAGGKQEEHPVSGTPHSGSLHFSSATCRRFCGVSKLHCPLPGGFSPCSARGAAAAAQPLSCSQGHNWDLSVCTLGSTLASLCVSCARHSERVCCAAPESREALLTDGASLLLPFTSAVRSDFVDKPPFQFVI